MTLTVEHAAANLAAVTRRLAKGRRYIGVVASITDRETTGNVTVNVFFRTNPITVQMRNIVDVAAEDEIFIKEDPAVHGVFVFDGFAKGGGGEGANNDSGDPIPWAITPGVTSPPGDDLTIAPAAGQSTFFASGVEINAATADEPVLILQSTDDNAANPILEVQGSGAAVLANVTPTGGALFSDKVVFTQTDGNEAIDSLADGFMDYLATTAHRFDNDIVLPKTSGKGIKIDAAAPTFGWRDITGEITNAGGANKPTSQTYRGGIDQFQFAAGDESIIRYHIPHDYVPGTDIHLHVHWSHISAIVTGGTITFTVEASYAKGHNQAAFSAPVIDTFTGTASTTQYQHIVSEVQFSASSPAGLQLDTDDLEPDGVILIRLEMTTNDITSGGAVPDPFIHEVDVHYQSTNMATKNKAPDFYA